MAAARRLIFTHLSRRSRDTRAIIVAHPYDIDMTAGKAFTLTVRFKLPFYVQAFNLFNQTQWLGGRIDDVAPIEYTESERSILEP